MAGRERTESGFSGPPSSDGQSPPRVKDNSRQEGQSQSRTGLSVMQEDRTGLRHRMGASQEEQACCGREVLVLVGHGAVAPVLVQPQTYQLSASIGVS